MFFRSPRLHEAMQRALRAAIASHRAPVLAELLAVHGPQACARALADLSPRVVADALSMWPAAGRADVLRYLPRDARDRLSAAGGSGPGAAGLPCRSPFSLLVGRWQGAAAATQGGHTGGAR